MQHNLNDCGFLLDKQLRGKRAEGGNEKNCFLWGFLFLFGKNLGRKSEDHSLYIELTEKKYLLSSHLCLSSIGLGIILELVNRNTLSRHIGL